jgi:hypothetical protein
MSDSGARYRLSPTTRSIGNPCGRADLLVRLSPAMSWLLPGNPVAVAVEHDLLAEVDAAESCGARRISQVVAAPSGRATATS